MNRKECQERLALIEPTIEEMGIEQMIQNYVNGEGTVYFHMIYEEVCTKYAETLESTGLKEYFTVKKWDEISLLLAKYLVYGNWQGLSRNFLMQLPNEFMSGLLLHVDEILEGLMDQILKNYLSTDNIFIKDSCGDFDVMAYYIHNDFFKENISKKRQQIIRENKAAKQFLERVDLADRVEKLWKSSVVQSQVRDSYFKFKKFAEDQLIKNAPEELQHKGKVFLDLKEEWHFNEDAYMIFVCNVEAAYKAYEAFRKELTDEEILKDLYQTIKETADMLLNELVEKMYQIPQEIMPKISNFVVYHLI